MPFQFTGGYIYDGKEPFEKLPNNYRCPVCQAPKRRWATGGGVKMVGRGGGGAELEQSVTHTSHVGDRGRSEVGGGGGWTLVSSLPSTQAQVGDRGASKVGQGGLLGTG